jgi:hypothetical protein
MVYFNGPDGWHKMEWKISSKFEKGMPGWDEFISSKAKQRIWLDPETGAAEVQSEKVSTRNANAYLVLHMGEDANSKKVVPLGTFDLPRSADEAASLLLLRTKPELADKIKKIISDNGG